MSNDKRDPFEVDTSREDLAKRYDGANVGGLPVAWKDGTTGKTQLRQTLVQPTAQEHAAFSSKHAEVCGNCKYFDLESGRKEIVKQRFAEKLVKEYEWQLRHLGASPDAIALCGASGGELAVIFVSKSCDQFRRKG